MSRVKKISMPTAPGFVSSSFRLQRVIGATQSIFTGKQKFQDFGGNFWLGEVSLPLMKHTQAKEWQAFLLEAEGPLNVFEFCDPDENNQGTYDNAHFKTENRINNTDVTLSFATDGTITAGASTFANAVVGDFIHITGATNEENNGTHKITTKTSNTVVVCSASELIAESSTASCKVRQNIKGATGLSLRATSNTATGTLKKGDYIAVRKTVTTDVPDDTTDPVQLLLVTEDATLTTQSGSPDHYAVKTQPPLRADVSAGTFVRFSNPKGMFRLVQPEQGWGADHNSNYSISFSITEAL